MWEPAFKFGAIVAVLLIGFFYLRGMRRQKFEERASYLGRKQLHGKALSPAEQFEVERLIAKGYLEPIEVSGGDVLYTTTKDPMLRELMM